MNIELNNRSVEIRNKINFYLYHICGIKKYNISILPEKKTWNVKGYKCAKLICCWELLVKEIPELTYTSNILKNMKRFLKVIYTYSFDTNELIQDKLWVHSE